MIIIILMSSVLSSGTRYALLPTLLFWETLRLNWLRGERDLIIDMMMSYNAEDDKDVDDDNDSSDYDDDSDYDNYDVDDDDRIDDDDDDEIQRRSDFFLLSVVKQSFVSSALLAGRL